MTFLKKLGEILVKGLAIAIGVGPVVAQAVPGAGGIVTLVASDLEQIQQIIVEVEAMGASLGLPGADKLRAAAPLVAQILLQSKALVGKPIANGPLFTQGATKIADGFADVLNSVHPDAAQTVSASA